MKKGILIIFIMLMTFTGNHVSAQSKTDGEMDTSDNAITRLSGSAKIYSGLTVSVPQNDLYFYASGLTAFNMPVSLTSSYSKAVKCQGAGFGFGAGYTYSFNNRWSYNPGLHITTAYYSDWRVNNRPLSSIIIDVADFGFALNERGIPLSINANIGVGLMLQYNYDDSDAHENMGKSEFQARAGLTFRAGLSKNFIVKTLIEGYTLAADREPIPLYFDSSNGAPNNRGFQVGLGVEYKIDLFGKKSSHFQGSK